MATDMNHLLELEKRMGISYADLEKLLMEFYSPVTDNAKKKEIGDFLMKFSTASNTWELCVIYISYTFNELMLMFCANVLENSIQRHHRTPEEKSLIRLTAYKLLTSSSSQQQQTSTQHSANNNNVGQQQQQQISSFIRNKLVKLIVIIAKMDWPTTYPHFFDEIFTLLSLEEYVELGLTFVQMASEEFLTPREDVLAERKVELMQLLSGHVPDLLNIFTGILLSAKRRAESIIDSQHGINNMAAAATTTTTSSSLTTTTTTLSSSVCLDPKCASIMYLTLRCLCSMFTWIDPTKVSNNNNHINDSNNNSINDSNNNSILTIFDTKRDLFAIILELATKFCFDKPSALATTTNDVINFECSLHKCCSNCCRSSIATNALSCICELMTRTFSISASKMLSSSSSSPSFPNESYLQFVANTFEVFYSMLMILSKNDANNRDKNALDDLEEGYLNKMIEYFRSFILTHMHKFLTNQNFPFTQFLALFIQFTFKQPTNENYFRCLDIWNEFIDSISSKIEECRNDTNAQLIKYQEVLLALFVSVSDRIQFKTNQSQLEMLDDDILDDDFKTEWQSYLMENINIIVGIGKLFPAQVFQHLFQPFNESLSIYLDLKRFITTTTTTSPSPLAAMRTAASAAKTASTTCLASRASSSAAAMTSSFSSSSLRSLVAGDVTAMKQQQQQGVVVVRKLNITAENDCRRLHCSLRDFSTALQIQASLVDHLIGENFEKNFNSGCSLMERLITVADYGSQLKLYDISSPIENVLEADFIEVHAQTLAVLKTCSVWLAQFYVRSRSSDEGSRSKCDGMIDVLLSSVIPLFLQESVPEKILLSGSHLLLSLLTTVCPVAAYNSNKYLQQLYISGILVCNVPPEVELLTYRALTHYLLIPWPTTTNQEWERRGQLMTSFVNHLIGDYVLLGDEETYVKLRLNGEFRESMRPAVEKTLTIVTDIINHLDVSGGKKQKIMSYACFRSSIHLALKLLPVYISNSEVSSLFLQLILAVVQVHRIEMGAQAVASLIQPVMQLFTKELIMDCLTDEKSASHQIVEKFLQILSIIASEPGQTFKKFLPSILDLSLRQVYPLLAERQIPDVKASLFSLFHSILKHNWKFFFPSTLLAAAAKSSDQLNNQSASFTREQYFSGIMQALGQSFLQTDVELFRHNLSILESLNDRFKLYEKPAFKNFLLSDFLSVLLHTLFNKSHDLLRDDITTAIFNMAATDFEYFYSTFVVGFLATVELSSDVQKQRLLIALQREKDLPTFSKNLENFVNDLRYYKLNCCQTPN